MIKAKILLFIAVVSLAGCATGSALVTGVKRDPIDPSDVQIYRSEPDVKFEYIGIVKSEAEEIFSQHEALDLALKELKIQAAKIGANGIILKKIGEKQDNYAGYTPYASGGGSFYSGTTEYQALQGDAIYLEIE